VTQNDATMKSNKIGRADVGFPGWLGVGPRSRNVTHAQAAAIFRRVVLVWKSLHVVECEDELYCFGVTNIH
jgi:hypothetical protein